MVPTLKSRLFQALLIGLATAMPIAIMADQKSPSLLFYLSLLAGVLILTTYRAAGLSSINKEYKYVLWCLATPTIAVVFSGVMHGKLSGPDLEIALRWLLGTWIIVSALSYTPRPWRWQILWGYIAAAVVATAYILYLAWPDWHRPQTSAVYNAVGYGNLTLLLAVITLLSVRHSFTRWETSEKVLKLAISLFASIAFAITQTRTGWVAVPVFCLIAAVLYIPPQRPGRIAIVTLLALAVLGGAFASSDTLRNRAYLAYEEASTCTGTNKTADNSICIRLQLWRASIDMLKQRPLDGFGKRSLFSQYLQDESQPKGLVSPNVAKNWGEPHNDLLLALASFGIPGGLALLLIYLGPAWLFARRLSTKNSESVRTAAAIGLAICLGMLIFGQFETMWRGMRTVSFYAMSLGVFLSLSSPNKAYD